MRTVFSALAASMMVQLVSAQGEQAAIAHTVHFLCLGEYPSVRFEGGKEVAPPSSEQAPMSIHFEKPVQKGKKGESMSSTFGLSLNQIRTIPRFAGNAALALTLERSQASSSKMPITANIEGKHEPLILITPEGKSGWDAPKIEVIELGSANPALLTSGIFFINHTKGTLLTRFDKTVTTVEGLASKYISLNWQKDVSIPYLVSAKLSSGEVLKLLETSSSTSTPERSLIVVTPDKKSVGRLPVSVKTLRIPNPEIAPALPR